MESVFETLRERGLIQQCSDETRVARLLLEKTDYLLRRF